METYPNVSGIWLLTQTKSLINESGCDVELKDVKKINDIKIKIEQKNRFILLEFLDVSEYVEKEGKRCGILSPLIVGGKIRSWSVSLSNFNDKNIGIIQPITTCKEPKKLYINFVENFCAYNGVEQQILCEGFLEKLHNLDN